MKKWFRVGLETVGALSLLILVVGAVCVIRFGPTASPKVNHARPNDVLFILRTGGISTNQSFKVIASYESARSFTGDHLDYYCIELSKFDVADDAKNRWHDGPEKNPLLAEALEQGVNDALQDGDCFPSAEEANSEAMKIMFREVVLIDYQPTAADIVLYDRRNKRLYYVSYKT